MEGVFKLNKEHWTIDKSHKVITKDQNDSLLTANEMMDQARKQISEKMQEIDQVYKQRFDEGYSDGVEEGKAEYTMKILDTVLTSVDSLETLEQQLVDVVLSSVSKIIGQLESQEIVVKIVQQALSSLRGEKRILVRVAPTATDAIKQELKPFLLSADGSFGYIEVRGDPSLNDTDCYLETQMGVVEASLDTQIKRLKEALESRVNRRNLS